MLPGRRNLLQKLKHDEVSGCEDMLDLPVCPEKDKPTKTH